MLCCSDPRVSQAMSEQGDKVAARLAAFVRTLRDNAFAVGARETEDAAKVLASDIGMRPAYVRQAFRALFSARHADWSKFDDIFDAFWLGRGMKAAVRSRAQTASPQGTDLRDRSSGSDSESGAPGLGDQATASGEAEDDADASGIGRMEGASRIETIAATDFRKINDPAALATAHALAERLARQMRARLTRRTKDDQRGRRIDFRRTIRRSIQSGGTPLRIIRRERAQKPLRLLVLLDVSGSMSQYTAIFVRFVHGVLQHFRKSEAFLVHTSLSHISPALAERDAARALDRLSLIAQGVGGGTRIGESLATFNKWHARRAINSRTCVMIVSDGYDTGPPELLGAEMQALRRRCRRIVWLNPMIGWDGYQPTARGMQAALPYVDLFAPANSIESLAALEPYLSRI
ncbi:MAG: VWA domain-containing protein [Hyphomicrobium sp.]|uniref:vWA domain-containing protein n=1 Tax=Hyphomicrobium sp. TaxID=82 RepID=UPI003D1511E5